jgi:hypothetical protein
MRQTASVPSLIIREPGQVAYVVELETTLTAGRDR